MEETEIWYAVMANKRDSWDIGTYNKAEAIQMLREQGKGIIQAVDWTDHICLYELKYEEVV